MTTPVHMEYCNDALDEFPESGFDPKWYKEDECAKCGQSIYKYLMDIIVEWKHFNHSTYCNNNRAIPKGRITGSP